MYEYPFGNGQQLNLDWFLAEWKNLLAAWEAEKNGIEGALQAEIDRAEAALADVFAARDAAAQSAANALESKNAAAQSASDASGYLATVQADANAARDAAQNAAQSESNAADSAQTAVTSKNAAGQSERNAAQSEANANSSKTAAAQSASDADASKSAAAQSAADALANKNAAAQSAEDASDAAASVEESAQQIAINTTEIANLKESISGIGTDERDETDNIIKFDSTTDSIEKITADTTEITSVITRCGKNLLPKFNSGNSNGLTWTVADDGTVTFTGTPTADTYVRIDNIYIPYMLGAPYTLALFNNLTDNRLTLTIQTTQSGNVQLNLTQQNAKQTFITAMTGSIITRILFRVPANFDATGLIIKPIFILGESIDEYEEYKGQTFNVTLVNGVVQESIPLLNGINTLWASNGNITVTFAAETGKVDEYVEKQINNIINSFYQYKESGNNKYLKIYFKSGNNYVMWQLHNVPTSDSNSNTWQLGAIYSIDNKFNPIAEIVTSGEFELAFKEHNAEDFCGGNNHGDENTIDFIVFIDGKKVDLTNIDSDIHPFNRIDAIEHASINRCNTPSEIILTHQKVWNFENGKVKVHQSLKFLETLEVDGMLICMFPANRSHFDYGVRGTNIETESLTTPNYSIIRTLTNHAYYLMYGNKATAKISAKSFRSEGNSGLWINPTSALNKLYYTYWNESSAASPINVPANTLLEWEQEYDVAVKETD